MSLHLTPEMLVSSYELLRTTPPFRRWKLPHADDVEFHVTKHVDRLGDFVDAGHAHVIRISDNCHSTLAALVATMAHEMCHMRLNLTNPTDKATHGARFKKLARQACRHHGFDLKMF